VERGYLVAQDFEVRVELYTIAALDGCVRKALAFAVAVESKLWLVGCLFGIALGQRGRIVAVLASAVLDGIPR
jgi:hypothetical protein